MNLINPNIYPQNNSSIENNRFWTNWITNILKTPFILKLWTFDFSDDDNENLI